MSGWVLVGRDRGGIRRSSSGTRWRCGVGRVSRSQVARELGVNDMSLGLWIKKSDESSPMSEEEKADRAEAARLRKRVKELEEEVEILKRFTAYWVKDSGR